MVNKFIYEPCRLPLLLTHKEEQLQRTHRKQLGISPSVENGIRTWRVIWRPFLATPIPYTKRNGKPGLKRKADHVCTERYPIIDGITEEQAFREAAIRAAAVYRTPQTVYMPKVNWEQMARIKKVKLRDRYAKPGLNESIRTRAEELAEKGWTDRSIAEELGVNRSTVNRWRNKKAPA